MSLIFMIIFLTLKIDFNFFLSTFWGVEEFIYSFDFPPNLSVKKYRNVHCDLVKGQTFSI